MTKRPTHVRILMTPSWSHDDDDRPQAYAGPATMLTGLPRMIRRHELRLIVPLADSTIFERLKRGEFPPRFNLSPRCVVRDLAEIKAWLEQRRSALSCRRSGCRFHGRRARSQMRSQWNDIERHQTQNLGVRSRVCDAPHFHGFANDDTPPAQQGPRPHVQFCKPGRHVARRWF